jgi:serine/threonine protein phosphatase PrpC
MAASVLGAAHRRIGKENQDAVGSKESWLGSIVAVADGHGSALCVRSGRGSRLALQAGFDAVDRVCRAGGVGESLAGTLERLTREGPLEIVRTWRRIVEEDLERQPLTQTEIEGAGSAGAKRLPADPVLAYGTTLLLCVAGQSHVAFLQLGDGDSITVTPSGQVSRPLPADPRLIANETTSLSGEDAWKNFRTGVEDLSASPLALILLSTDGYSNSFRDDESFRRVGSDILQNLTRAGIEKVRETLPAWLEEATSRGSSDDISAVVLFRPPAESQTSDSTAFASRAATEVD